MDLDLSSLLKSTSQKYALLNRASEESIWIVLCKGTKKSQCALKLFEW